jgi:hypothetical protein
MNNNMSINEETNFVEIFSYFRDKSIIFEQTIRVRQRRKSDRVKIQFHFRQVLLILRLNRLSRTTYKACTI